MKAKVDTYHLIKLWNEEGSEEHEGPAGQIEKRDYKFVFVVVSEISDVHTQ